MELRYSSVVECQPKWNVHGSKHKLIPVIKHTHTHQQQHTPPPQTQIQNTYFAVTGTGTFTKPLFKNCILKVLARCRTHTCNSSTRETEAGVQSHFLLHSKRTVNHSYMNPVSKQNSYIKIHHIAPS